MASSRALLNKEITAIFYSPMAYAVIAVFVMLASYTFCAQLFHTRSAGLGILIYQVAMLFILTMPLITMRQIAEERRNGTLELLLSTPVSDLAVVLAKFAASLTVAMVILILMLALPAALSWVTEPDWGAITSGFVGLFLLAAMLSALGLAISSFSNHQLTAAIISLGLFLMLWMSETLGVMLPAPFDEFAIALSLDNRLAPFATGAIFISDIGYFLSVTLAGIALCVAGLARR